MHPSPQRGEAGRGADAVRGGSAARWSDPSSAPRPYQRERGVGVASPSGGRDNVAMAKQIALPPFHRRRDLGEHTFE